MLVTARENLRAHLLVELHVVLELGHDRARERLDLDLLADRLGQDAGLGLEVVLRARCSGRSARGRGPRPAPSRCRRAASGAAARSRACRPRRSPRGDGSSSPASFCVASRICLSARITSSSALIDFSRPTKSGTIMCGKTTMSRSGRTGKVLSPEGTPIRRGVSVIVFPSNFAPRPRRAAEEGESWCRWRRAADYAASEGEASWRRWSVVTRAT